ncbi:MAG TPA: hypothetical protein VFE20_07775 [Thermoleophilia bacterium]|nr:hypothetical protein [Thermoleophilia bacterium]
MAEKERISHCLVCLQEDEFTVRKRCGAEAQRQAGFTPALELGTGACSHDDRMAWCHDWPEEAVTWLRRQVEDITDAEVTDGLPPGFDRIQC